MRIAPWISRTQLWCISRSVRLYQPSSPWIMRTSTRIESKAAAGFAYFRRAGHKGGDGSEKGNLYVAAKEIAVYSAEGHPIHVMEMKELPSDRKSTRLNSSHLGISY